MNPLSPAAEQASANDVSRAGLASSSARRSARAGDASNEVNQRARVSGSYQAATRDNFGK